MNNLLPREVISVPRSRARRAIPPHPLQCSGSSCFIFPELTGRAWHYLFVAFFCTLVIRNGDGFAPLLICKNQKALRLPLPHPHFTGEQTEASGDEALWRACAPSLARAQLRSEPGQPEEITQTGPGPALDQLVLGVRVAMGWRGANTGCRGNPEALLIRNGSLLKS